MKTLPVLFGRKGFTLIELLIVIVIIGILAGVVLVVLNPAKQQRKSAESVLSSNTNKICLALNSCAATASSGASCDTLDEMGAASPDSTPTGATYTSSLTTNVVNASGTLSVGGGSEGSVGCIYSCAFNFNAGTATALAASSGCW